ncbi:class A sortase [Enterococcus sp. AZ109]|uniref:class A sortase n=1 Tax=Enterococcus sp. AZ109 TaxID=2774634 RepID=UPI003F214174
MNKIVLRVLMLALLIVGTAFISLNIAKGWLLVFHQSEDIEINSQIETIEPKFQQIEPITLTDVLQNPTTTNQAMGTLVIPDLEMTLPVFAGLESVDLLTGAGTMFPERNPKNNNIVIVGHHVGYSELLFGGLGQLENGASILLNYLGEDYAYEVTKNQVISETQISVVDETDRGELTLLTCDQAGATDNRIMVKAAQLQEASVATSEDMAANAGRKIPLKLVLQTLLVVLVFAIFVRVIFGVTKKE